MKHAVKRRFSCPQSKYLLGELLAHFGPDVDYFLCAAGAHYDGELEGEIQELADRLVGPASYLIPDYDSIIVRSVLRATPSPILGILSFNAIRWLCDKYQHHLEKSGLQFARRHHSACFCALTWPHGCYSWQRAQAIGLRNPPDPLLALNPKP